MRVIEGTWEEIECHKAELIGRHLRVLVIPEQSVSPKTTPPTQVQTIKAQTPRVSALGKYAGVLSSADFMRQKQEEIDLEDQTRE